MSRAEAVAHCKSAPGGAVIVIEARITKQPTELVEVNDAATSAVWNDVRVALREG